MTKTAFEQIKAGLDEAAIVAPRSLKRRSRMIDWTDAAIEAAFDEAMECFDDVMMVYHQDQIRQAMRAALDAAARAQGCPKLPDCKTYADRAYAEARADALEEAAKVAWNYGDEVSVSKYDSASSAIAANRMAVNIAAAIRALKETSINE